MRQILANLLLFVAIIANAQNDTLHIATDRRDDVVYSRYYVINDSQFMIVWKFSFNNLGRNIHQKR